MEAERLIEGIRIRKGQPTTLLEMEEVFLMPGMLCLYDKHGQRIPESCLRRGPGMSEYFKAGPQSIEVPKACAIIRKPLLYLSWVVNHWGHFLTEGVSRVWARSAWPDLRELRCLSLFPFPQTTSIAEYLLALGISPDGLRHFKVPVRIDRCFIPGASFANRAEAWTVHLQPSHEVIAAFGPDSSPETTRQPVFLSRSRLGSDRLTRRELELEETLGGLGVRIVHPERLSLAEQIRLFNSHEVFIGPWGSAFHGLCLARAPERITTHVIVNSVPNANYLMFDALLGCTSNYVQAMYATPGQPRGLANPDLTIDVEAVLDYLRGSGCV
jgi:capsular polysaccharide biosynthesis protein